jgi:osmotically-inducible protein OsmY
MARIRSLLIGGAVGAAAIYFLDPEEGAARRARVQDRIEGLARELQDRARGAMGRLDTSIASRADDDLSLLGRVEVALLTLPDVERGSVETEVVDGQVVLRGDVASVEQERELVETAGRVPGVAGVESQLQLQH